MTPEQEAAIRERHVKHDDWWCEAGERILEALSECETRQVLAALDAARADRDRLRTALENLLADTQHADHGCRDADCPVSLARAALKGT